MVSAPGQNPNLDRQVLSMMPETKRKSNKRKIINNKLFNVLPPGILEVIHETLGRFFHQERIFAVVAQLNSTKNPTLYTNMHNSFSPRNNLDHNHVMIS